MLFGGPTSAKSDRDFTARARFYFFIARKYFKKESDDLGLCMVKACPVSL